MEEEIEQLKKALANLAAIVEDNRKLIGENMRDITDLMKKKLTKLLMLKNSLKVGSKSKIFFAKVLGGRSHYIFSF